MEYPHLAKQDDGDPATFPLNDFTSKFIEKRFDILPVDIGAGRVRENAFQRALVLPLPSINGTINEYYGVITKSFWRLPARLNPLIHKGF